MSCFIKHHVFYKAVLFSLTLTTIIFQAFSFTSHSKSSIYFHSNIDSHLQSQLPTFVPLTRNRYSFVLTSIFVSQENVDREANDSSDRNSTSLPPLYIDKTSLQNKHPIISSSKSSQRITIQESFDRISNHLYDTNNHHTDTTKNMETNKKIVRYGQSFRAKKIYQPSFTTSSSESTTLSSPIERVPGCIANVDVQTKLIPISSSINDNDIPKDQLYRVHLLGTADALLSQGLVAILSVALSGDDASFQQIIKMMIPSQKNHASWEGLTAKDVLSIDPYTVTDSLKLRNLLSPGRNDGLASMLQIVQSQISSLLASIHRNEAFIEDDDKFGGTAMNSDTLTTHLANDKQQNDTKDKPTVAMLLSGGVDSSVALNLLTRENYNVTAFYLKIWLEDELAHLGQCPWEDDYRTCQAVCEHANVPLETISLQKEYKNKVIQYTVAEAQKGRTPNPDIMCNSRVKFGCFYDAIEGRGFDYVATGHYARLETTEESTNNEGAKIKKMIRAPDPIKDQSYFLSMLTQNQLSKVLFPIGKYTKKEVRALAEKFDLPNKFRPESQGLCFLGKVKFEDFLGAYLGENPGDILDASSTDVVLGKHKGLWFHTVGQRKGIGKLLDPKATAHGPWYIVAKDTKKNALLASNQYDEEVFARARSEFYVEDLTWISGSPPKRLLKQIQDGDSASNAEVRFNMKIRHGPKIAQGILQLVENDTTGTDMEQTEFSSSGRIVLDHKDGGLAPGQFVVFYGVEKEGDDDEMECFGAGVISEKHWARFLFDNNVTLTASIDSADRTQELSSV